jgi:hypothetical protein
MAHGRHSSEGQQPYPQPAPGWSQQQLQPYPQQPYPQPAPGYGQQPPQWNGPQAALSPWQQPPPAMTGELGSEQVILAAPFSFAGSTRRIWRWLRPRVAAATGWPRFGWWSALWTLLVLAWLGVAAWYAVLAAFGLVPLAVLIVFRVVRRTQRRGERNRLRHRELLGREAGQR